MGVEAKKNKTINEILKDRRFHLANLHKLIGGNYESLTKVENLSLGAIESMINGIDIQLRRK